MKILVIGDLHGRKPVIKKKDFDAIVCVGDFCSDKELAPWTKKWFESLNDSDDSTSLDAFLKLHLGKRGVEAMERRSLDEGKKILKYLDSFGKPVLVVPGNWDQSYGYTRIKDLDASMYNYLKSFYDFWLGERINPKLVKGLKNIYDCQYKCRKVLGINFVGYGLVSNNESLTRRKNKSKIKGKLTAKQFARIKADYEKIILKLDKAFGKRNKKFPTIFISHNIPQNTNLDVIIDKKNYAHGKHLGSSVARKFCLKYQPLLCLGGHIHDGRGKDKIKKTFVVNPGFGSRAQVLIDLDEKKAKIKSIKFLK